MPWVLLIGLALLCVVLGLLFWFRHVQRIMVARQEAVTIADKQRQSAQKFADSSQSAETFAVLERSENIYSQAVILYAQALESPMNRLPATIMGFHPLEEKVCRCQTSVEN